MKKQLLPILLFTVTNILFADMTYDPINNEFITTPVLPEIDQNEYGILYRHCIQMQENIKHYNHGKYPSNKELLKQFSAYLKKVGTATALRLMSDLKKNKIFYPDGTLFRKITID